MSLAHRKPQSWEQRLLGAAQEAFDSHKHLDHAYNDADAVALARAYHRCAEITRQHSKTFYVASGLLPKEKRQAVRALYAFCRVTDDIVDCAKPTDDRLAKLSAWEAKVMSPHTCEDDDVCRAWADARARFGIPRGYAKQLIEGCARDVVQTRYRTFDELAEYAYSVASTVGLMAMSVIGFRDESAMPYAIRLGVALQMTNILRDVGEDWRNGRLYLPLDELAQFDLSEADIATGKVTERWRSFMRFQIARNRQLYAESFAGIRLLDADGRFAIAAAAKLYEAILCDIEAHDYDVFTRRAHLSTLGKLSRLPYIWWLSRTAKH